MISAVNNINRREAVDKLARVGFITRGIVYGTIGILAAKLALGFGGTTTDTDGAIKILSNQPFGQFLLIILCIGFAGYALWRFVQAFNKFDTHDKKSSFKSVTYIIMGLINGGLSYFALKLFMNRSSSSSSTQSMTAKLMSQPMGLWLVGIFGLAFIGAGVYQFYKAYKEKFKDDLMTEKMDHKEMEITTKVAKAGLSSRGIVFSIVGFFLIQSALKHNPSEAKGLDQALRVLIEQPYGAFMLGIVALGLIAYSVFSFINARYNKIKVY